MPVNQLNKLQIKAEILTAMSKLQVNSDLSLTDKILETLIEQDDKKSILDILIKELAKADEQKAVLICFLGLKLCDEKEVENELWNTLKNPSVKDSTKTVILNLLKDLGNKVDYEKIGEYFENPNEVIDADTQRLLHVAIVNPEAQIDFLDFANSLPEHDKKILIESLSEDYSSDDLANILNPLFLFEPSSEIGKTAISVLGTTKSQLALHSLLEALDFVDDAETVALIKKNISQLKIAGVREDNAVEFYKNVLSSTPYNSYTSYPDGHGNQALIFSREKENGTVQMFAVVTSDTEGIVDCFGFNEVTKKEFERIVDRFYNGDGHVYINAPVIKNMLLNAEKLTRKAGGKISYEYICWRTLLSDIEVEPVPMELILNTEFKADKLSDEELDTIYQFEFIQRWFFDTEYNDEFGSLIKELNSKMMLNDFKIDFDNVIEENLEKIFTTRQKKILDKRILMSAYLKYLSGNKTDTQLLYSLYFDENMKQKLEKNILRKSIYEYYVALKFRYKDEHKMTNIFAMKNKPKTIELTAKQIDLAIVIIEGLWVK